VRIPRDPLLGHVPSHPGLFPAGEGAGQAGGIISAALDGRQAASLLHFGGGGTEMIDRFLPAQE
jgi:uncharacterized FAD-dependent dehydrogenase